MLKRLLKTDFIFYIFSIILLHFTGIFLLLLFARGYPALIGMAVLAYTLGLRHAFDADHIAAIDNTTRKLIQQNQKSGGVGFFFSLGHSTIVFIMTLALALSIGWAQTVIPAFQQVGGFIGTIVSGSFLLFIGILNLIVLLDLKNIFVKMRKAKYDEDELEDTLQKRGFVARYAKPLFRVINKSWHVYPLGMLFGLGFDTASEVALLAVSAEATYNHISLLGILSLPVAFAAGMSLMDTADGIFMTKAYNWAFTTPLRKVYYNLTITFLSVIAALLIGVTELLQILSEKLELKGGFWTAVNGINLGWFGYLLIILFFATWIISYAFWKVLKIETRWSVK